jgi:hypothetical protein
MEPESSPPYPTSARHLSLFCANSIHSPRPLQLPEDPSLYYPPIYVLVSPTVSFPQVSPPTPCAHLYPPPYSPNALSISFVSILPPAQYWVRIADHSAPRYAAFSIYNSNMHNNILCFRGRMFSDRERENSKKKSRIRAYSLECSRRGSFSRVLHH